MFILGNNNEYVGKSGSSEFAGKRGSISINMISDRNLVRINEKEIRRNSAEGRSLNTKEIRRNSAAEGRSPGLKEVRRNSTDGRRSFCFDDPDQELAKFGTPGYGIKLSTLLLMGANKVVPLIPFVDSVGLAEDASNGSISAKSMTGSMTAINKAG